MSNDTAERKAIKTEYRYSRNDHDTDLPNRAIVPSGYGQLDKKTVLRACSVALKSMNQKSSDTRITK